MIFATPALTQEKDVKNVLSSNPVSILFGYVSAGYERTLSPSSSISFSPYLQSSGLGTMGFTTPDNKASWSAGGNAEYLLYPDENAPEGFFFGASAGAGYFEFQELSGDGLQTWNGISLTAGVKAGFRMAVGKLSLTPEIRQYCSFPLAEVPEADKSMTSFSGFYSVWGIGIGWLF